jgi:hypothetical protein
VPESTYHFNGFFLFIAHYETMQEKLTGVTLGQSWQLQFKIDSSRQVESIQSAKVVPWIFAKHTVRHADSN